VNDAKEMASENLKTVQDRFNHRKHKLEREGKEIELTEKTLWDEVFYIGPSSQAGEILKKIHPQVFEMYETQDLAAQELKKFAIVEMGMNFEALTLSDYLKATESLFELMLEERGIHDKEKELEKETKTPLENLKDEVKNVNEEK
jgi:hypothetical protein